MNILFICMDRVDATAFYRSSGIAHDLQNRSGHDITVIQWNETVVQWQLLSNFEIIMMQRPFTKVAAELCLYVKNMGKSIWVDYDDNLFAVNPENRTFDIYSNPETQENVKSIIKMADVVTVPTEYLRQGYISLNKNIVVIPNAFNDSIFVKRELPERKKTCVWRGPDAHIYDLMTYGKEINRCTQEFEYWEFLFMGYRPWFLADTKNKGYIPALDMIMYFTKLFEQAPSILHIPLHDNTFNRCRSNVAALEGSYAGAAIVCPGWWNMPGTLPYSDGESYYEAMRSLLSGDVDVVAQNAITWEYIQDCLTLSKVNQERINLINTLI